MKSYEIKLEFIRRDRNRFFHFVRKRASKLNEGGEKEMNFKICLMQSWDEFKHSYMEMDKAMIENANKGMLLEEFKLRPYKIDSGCADFTAKFSPL